MKVEQERIPLRSATARAPSPRATPVATDWTASQPVRDVLERLTGEGPRYVARAPGRLDVMGGSAEYSGSLVLTMTVAEHVCVGVQPREDGLVSIAAAQPADMDGQRPLVVDLVRLREAQGTRLTPDGARSLLGGSTNDTARGVLGALIGSLAAEVVPDLGGGLSIVVGSSMDELGDLGQEAALGAAVSAAVARAMNATLDPLNVAAAIHRLAPEWFSMPVAMADVVGILTGDAYALTQVRCEPCKPIGSVSLPDDIVLVGIDCGVTHAHLKTKYEQGRTSVFMGRTLIDRILRHEGTRHLQWNGYLSRVSVTDYVERFRNRIPTKIKGREFLERFGETDDPLTRIDPNVAYRVRSRTEHHIYEHDRAHHFVECLSRAIRTADTQALSDAGAGMYGSHWSYGQRCGLGSVETDLLVSLLRQHGVEADIFGAKITGRGCGGVVAVLARATERATAAVHQVIRDYQKRMGHKATLIRGSSPGVLPAGVRTL